MKTVEGRILKLKVLESIILCIDIVITIIPVITPIHWDSRDNSHDYKEVIIIIVIIVVIVIITTIIVVIVIVIIIIKRL